MLTITRCGRDNPTGVENTVLDVLSGCRTLTQMDERETLRQDEAANWMMAEDIEEDYPTLLKSFFSGRKKSSMPGLMGGFEGL